MSKFTGEFKGNDAGRDKLRNFKATIPGKICASILGRQTNSEYSEILRQ